MPKDISSRIQKIIEVIQSIASGDFSARAKVSTRFDDVDDLAAGVNMLAEEMDERIRRIKASLEEKQTLLQEVHHRVKNNLQIISSLLNLQAQNIGDEQIKEIFKASQNRIKLIALVHEKLYQSKDLTKINFAEYIKNLTIFIFHSYDAHLNGVSLRIDVRDILIDMNTAISCGLIINELVSNSLKHAFPEDKKGEIQIKFYSDNNNFILIISDNGIGFPKELDFHKTKSLGLQLVNTSVEQLKGKIELDRTKGTKFKIKFPISQKNA